MAKKSVAASVASNPSTVRYEIASGVDRIHGKKVKGTTIELTPAEALYDLSLGRLIAPAQDKPKTDGGA